MQVNPFPFKRSVRIEMIPLIDMFFLLLVFFIFGIFSMSMQHGLLVDLPAANTAGAMREEALTISVTADGQLAVDRQPVTLSTLASVLRQRQAVQRPEMVFINADRQAVHGTVMAVLDTVRQVGIERVSFQTTPEQRDDQ